MSSVAKHIPVPKLGSSCMEFIVSTLWAKFNYHAEHCCDCKLKGSSKLCSSLMKSKRMVNDNLIETDRKRLLNQLLGTYAEKIRVWEETEPKIPPGNLVCIFLFFDAEVTTFRIDISCHRGSRLILSSLGENVRNIIFPKGIGWSSIVENGFSYYSASLWRNVLKRTTNLQMLDLNYCPAPSRILSLIGRHCSSIQIIRGIYLTGSVGVGTFTEFCFRNAWSDEPTLNSCCRTIVEADVCSCWPNYPDQHNQICKGIMILLHNIFYLKCLGPYFSLKELHAYIQSNKDHLSSWFSKKKMKADSTTLLLHLCRRIQSFYVNDRETLALTTQIYAAKLLVQIGRPAIWKTFNLTDMFGSIHHNNLRVLRICLPGNLIFSHLLLQCPNLEIFECVRFNSILRITAGEEETNHKSLRQIVFRHGLSIRYDSRNYISYDWIKLAASTIRSLCIMTPEESSLEKEAILSALKLEKFPKLEELIVRGLCFDADDVLKLLKDCPKLTTVGNVSCSIKIEIEERFGRCDLLDKELKVVTDDNYPTFCKLAPNEDDCKSESETTTDEDE